MADCQHEFIGHAEGVTCSLCGLRLSHHEYNKYLHGEPTVEEKKAKAPARKTKK